MTDTLLGVSVWMIVKVGALILLGLYLIFALVVVRQVKMMTQTLHLGFEGPIKFFSFIHLIFAGFVFLTALIIL